MHTTYVSIHSHISCISYLVNWYKHLNCLQGNVIMCKNNRQPPDISSQDLDLAIRFHKFNTQSQVHNFEGVTCFAAVTF